jgi:hypothetical protein
MMGFCGCVANGWDMGEDWLLSRSGRARALAVRRRRGCARRVPRLLFIMNSGVFRRPVPRENFMLRQFFTV